MQEKESLIEKDYRTLRGAVIYSLLPLTIRLLISFLFLFIGFFGLISLMRAGTFVGEIGCAIGGIITPVYELVKMVIIDLPAYAITGQDISSDYVAYTCDIHSWIPYAVCSGIIIGIGIMMIWAVLLFTRYARLTPAQKRSVRQNF